MKKLIKITSLLIVSILLLSSCVSQKNTVGEGAQGHSYHKEWNHHMFFGLIDGGSVNSIEMAGTATDYTVTTKQTFANFLLAVLTLGIYTPTETTVTR